MVILYTSDLHLDPKHLDRLLAAATKLRADAVIIGGDLIPVWAKTFDASIERQKRWIQDVLLPRLSSFHTDLPDIHLFLDFGNDDLMATRPLLEEIDGSDFNLLHNRVVSLDAEWALAGYMVVPPTPFEIKDWEMADCYDRPGLDDTTRRTGAKTSTGRERPYNLSLSHGTIQDDLEKLSENLESHPWKERPFILVSHSPPLDTALDCISEGHHVGSLAIRRFIERWGPTGRLRFSLHGHIHESPWISGKICERICGVPCYNIGQKQGELRALLFDIKDATEFVKLFIIGKETRAYDIS